MVYLKIVKVVMTYFQLNLLLIIEASSEVT
jgi:hypothetical protein